MAKGSTAAARAFRTGVLSVFDIGLRTWTTRSLVKPSSPADDARAIGWYWKRVGTDLQVAASEVAAEKADARGKEP